MLEQNPIPLSERSVSVMQAADRQAHSLRHNYLGPEHILLGLLGDATVQSALETLGVPSDKIITAVNFVIGRGDQPFKGPLKFTPQAETVLYKAEKTSIEEGESEIEPTDIFVGILRESESFAAGVLESLGISLNRAKLVTQNLPLQD